MGCVWNALFVVNADKNRGGVSILFYVWGVNSPALSFAEILKYLAKEEKEARYTLFDEVVYRVDGRRFDG